MASETPPFKPDEVEFADKAGIPYLKWYSILKAKESGETLSEDEERQYKTGKRVAEQLYEESDLAKRDEIISSIREERDELKANLEKAEEMIENRDTEINELKEKRDSLKTEKESLETKLSTYKKGAVAIVKATVAAKDKIHQEGIEKLREQYGEELNEVLEAYEEVKDQRSQEGEEITNLQDLVLEKNNEIEELKGQLKTKGDGKEDVKNLRKTIERLEMELTQKEEEIKSRERYLEQRIKEVDQKPEGIEDVSEEDFRKLKEWDELHRKRNSETLTDNEKEIYEKGLMIYQAWKDKLYTALDVYEKTSSKGKLKSLEHLLEVASGDDSIPTRVRFAIMGVINHALGKEKQAKALYHDVWSLEQNPGRSAPRERLAFVKYISKNLWDSDELRMTPEDIQTMSMLRFIIDDLMLIHEYPRSYNDWMADIDRAKKEAEEVIEEHIKDKVSFELGPRDLIDISEEYFDEHNFSEDAREWYLSKFENGLPKNKLFEIKIPVPECEAFIDFNSLIESKESGLKYRALRRGKTYKKGDRFLLEVEEYTPESSGPLRVVLLPGKKIEELPKQESGWAEILSSSIEEVEDIKELPPEIFKDERQRISEGGYKIYNIVPGLKNGQAYVYYVDKKTQFDAPIELGKVEGNYLCVMPMIYGNFNFDDYEMTKVVGQAKVSQDVVSEPEPEPEKKPKISYRRKDIEY